MPAPAPADKSTEKLAKSVDTITKLLQAHSGNPAQIKAKKDEEKKLVKDHKKVLGQWEEVLDDEKKQLEENKVRIFTMTSFIGNEAKRYFAQSESTGVTWAGLAKSIGTGVKNWFNAAKEQNTMLGRTLRFGAALWKGVNDHIIGSVKNIFSKIGSEMREVLGELAEVFDFIKGIFMGIFNFIKDAFLGFFKRAPAHDRKRNQLLTKIVDFMRRAEKRDMLEFAIPDASFQGLIMTLALIGAALVGGMIARFMLPFKVVFSALKLGVAFTKIKSFFLAIQWFGNKVFKIKWTFIKWGRKIAEVFGKFGPLANFAKVLGKLGRAFLWGFKVLGWPLTIILGVIDFIIGVVTSKADTWAGRIMDGLMKAVDGFLGLPVKLLGWVIEKVAGLFGVEVTGVADKIMGVIRWIVEAMFGWMKPIVGFIEGFISGGPAGAVKGFVDGIKSMINHLISIFPEPVQKMIIGFFSNLGEFFGILVEKFKGLLSWFGVDLAEGGGGGEAPVGTVASGDFMQMTDAEAKKIEAERQANQTAIVDAVEKQTKDQKDHNELLAKKQGDNIAVAMSQSGGYRSAPSDSPSTEQLPDEVDMGLAVFSNINASF